MPQDLPPVPQEPVQALRVPALGRREPLAQDDVLEL